MKHLTRFLHSGPDHRRSGVAYLILDKTDHCGFARGLARALLFAAIFAIAAASYAQTAPAKKSFQFHGKVTAVASDGVTVDGANVEGWMPAMTMKYKVDDPKVLKTVKVGDQIKATVYEHDYTLHKVQVEAKPK